MGIDIDRIIKEAAPPERLQVRRQAEAEARKLLEAGAANWSDDDANQFFDLLDRDYYNGGIKQTRFDRAFRGNNRQRMLAEREKLLPLLDRLYRCPEEEIGSTIDATLAISGVGRTLVSVILYLRDPQAFSCWGPRMMSGVGALLRRDVSGPRTGAGYAEYNAAAQQVRTAYGIAPEALDAVIWQVVNESEAPEPVQGQPSTLEPPIGPETFDVLAKLAAQPDKAFYAAHKAELGDRVQTPIQMLLKGAARQLPHRMKRELETEANLFGSILKNDFGKGGAWPYYWGALYPKHSKKTEDAQLYVWIDADALDVGFSIGQNGDATRARFAHNARQHADLVRQCMESLPGFSGLSFGHAEGNGAEKLRAGGDLTEWLADPSDLRAGVALPRERVIEMSFDQLRDRVVDIFKALYPLVLLATRDEPGDELAGISAGTRINPPYTLSEVATNTGVPEDVLRRWVRAVHRKGQAVFYGPPGTGKTFIAEHLARHLVGEGRGFVEVVQFHPAYAYEDFMQGIRPLTRDDGALEYGMEPGRFLSFCDRAAATRDKCVLIVDEINRANLSRVFGELMYLLEYRKRTVPLAGGGDFRIPDNVLLIGTMNTADRSIALVDHALRRRFAFIALRPDYAVLSAYLEELDFPAAGLISVLQEINDTISDGNYALGISYFMRSGLTDEIEDIWCMEIEPYLEEYFYGQPEKADRFRWNKVKTRILT